MTVLKELSPKKRTAVLAVIVFLVSFGVYFNVLFNGFVIDDSFQIIGNRWIKDVRYLPEIFTSNFVLGSWTVYYRPMVHVFYMTVYYLFGLKPLGFHLMSILFHSGNSVLVFFIISSMLEMTGPAPMPSGESVNGGRQLVALASALLFAVHPVHTEAVAWISDTDLFLTFFYLLSFYCYIRWDHDGRKKRGTYAVSVVSFFIATLCKEPALTLPAILIAYDYAFRKEGVPVSYYLKIYAPYLAASAVYFALRLNALSGNAPVIKHMEMTPYQFLIDVVVLFKDYVEKLLLPVDLNVWHVFHPPVSLFTVPGILALLSTICFFAVAFIAAKRNKAAFVGFLLILLPLLPAFYLPGLAQGLDNVFTERYLYLPSFGFILLVALFIVRINKARAGLAPWLAATVLAVIVVCSIGAVKRNFVWKDNLTLWTDAARKSPYSAVPHNGLGDALRQRGRIDDAIAQYVISLRLNPRDSFTHFGLGLAYSDKGWTDMAIAELQTALSFYPRSGQTHDALGVLYGSVGRHDQAVREFLIALDLNPDLDYVYKHLGIAYSNLGMKEKAIENFQSAIRLDPGDADSHNNLGVIYAEGGLMQKAAEQFESAAKLKPDDPSFHYNAARAYRSMGMADKAEEQVRMAQGTGKGKQ